MNTIKLLAVTAGGLGLMRPASGTWGSTLPVIVAFVLLLANANVWIVNGALIVLCLIACIACIIWGRWAEQRFNQKDPGAVVADEVAGQSLCLLALPYYQFDWTVTIIMLAAAFFLFRIFDILKLPPANQLQRLPEGWGILVDDLVAGVQAWIPMLIVFWLIATKTPLAG
ncbi:MAG: phosphatidylglycerophosphatase A [Phycisphaerales bacterium]|nr:phosphatidylglycerophosphatase A [Phycisphaerales bacterium]